MCCAAKHVVVRHVQEPQALLHRHRDSYARWLGSEGCDAVYGAADAQHQDCPCPSGPLFLFLILLTGLCLMTALDTPFQARFQTPGHPDQPD